MVLVSFCVGWGLGLGSWLRREVDLPQGGGGARLSWSRRAGLTVLKIEGMNRSIKEARPGPTDLDKACPMP